MLISISILRKKGKGASFWNLMFYYDTEYVVFLLTQDALEHRYPKHGHKGRWCKAQTCELNTIIRQGIVTFEHEIHEASIKNRHDDHGEDWKQRWVLSISGFVASLFTVAKQRILTVHRWWLDWEKLKPYLDFNFFEKQKLVCLKIEN